ncbi:hypothetical protein JKP88DRAFT_282959 [Tribonema minus]|uniref:Uncharacterized protein n=1 Tax=Tribonema minus TaxID=303371 RepID=A0A836C8J2_9STRA|nr:hypothetical protein JKP88DRAFT_282959 [Tribonema minus]
MGLHALTLLAAAGLVYRASAQATAGNDMCFSTTGKVQFAARNAAPVTAGAALATVGGTIKVNGITHIIPDNTECTLPAQTATWNDLFAIPKAMAAADQFFPKFTTSVDATGAIVKTVNPLAEPDLFGYEATLIGNIQTGSTVVPPPVGAATGPRYIVASLVNQCGYVQTIDADGTMTIGPTLDAPTGAKVRLNDPNGCYGPRTTTGVAGIAHPSDPLWGVDCDNPSVSPLFALRGPALSTEVDPDKRATQVPNPALFAAVVPGDFVCYAGVNVEYDPFVTTDDIVWIWGLESNLRLTTPPTSTCSYIFIEEILDGLGGNVATANAPTGVNTVTCPTDATKKWRKIADSLGIQQLVPIGRWLWDVNDIGLYDEYFLPGSRNYKVELSSQNPLSPCPAGLTANIRADVVNPLLTPFNTNNACARYSGRYSAPIGEYIFPEPPQYGSPINSCNFGDLPYLVADPAKPALAPLPNKLPAQFVADTPRLCSTPATPGGCTGTGCACFPDSFVPQGKNEGTFSQRNNGYQYIHVNALMGKTATCTATACNNNCGCSTVTSTNCGSAPNALPFLGGVNRCSNTAGTTPAGTTCTASTCTTQVLAEFFNRGTAILNPPPITLTRLGVTNQWTGTYTYTNVRPDSVRLTATGCCVSTQTCFRV